MMASPHGTPIWYELQTPDPDAATIFYEAVVGWSVEGRPTGEMDYRMIVADGVNVGGLTPINAGIPGAATLPGWLMYLGVDDVDAAAAAVVAAGGSIAMGPFDLPGTGRFAKVADPQGVPLYVMRGLDAQALSDVFSPTAMGRTSWNELATTDLDGATDFYVGLFGWHVGGSMPMGAMGDYRFLSLGPVALGAAMTRAADGPRAGWTFYFRVPDVDRAAAAIGAGGGTVRHGPVEVPGGDFVVIAADPDGAAFGVVGARGAGA